MMKAFFTTKKISVLAAVALTIGFCIFLFADAFFNRNFRTTQDKISTTEQVDLRRLAELKASGGGAVHFDDLKRRLDHDKILIVDGTHEFHGYLYGIPTTFFAYHTDHYTWKYAVRRFLFTGTTEVRPERVVPEGEEAQARGFLYVHFNVGSKFIPSDPIVDEMVSVLGSIPGDTWVHFHCHHGKGRTSMMMTMYDILKNAPHVSLADIIKRQHLLGSENLLDTTLWARGSYTQEQLNQRRDFITQFYDFVCQKKAGGVQEWSEWKSSNQLSAFSNQNILAFEALTLQYRLSDY